MQHGKHSESEQRTDVYTGRIRKDNDPIANSAANETLNNAPDISKSKTQQTVAKVSHTTN